MNIYNFKKLNSNSYLIRLFIVLLLIFLTIKSNSYIHPDEHFQGLEIIANKVLGFEIKKTWEFNAENSIRSFTILYIIYSPFFYIAKLFLNFLSPIQIWKVIRFQLSLMGIIVINYFIKNFKLGNENTKKIKFFIYSSYITLIYQNHCFSNSIETYIVFACISIINWIYDQKLIDKKNKFFIKKIMFFLGVLMSFGMFNRITFLFYFIIPSYHLIVCFIKQKRCFFLFSSGFFIASLFFIISDSLYYEKSIRNILLNPLNLKNYVITPLNNFIYNSKNSNLSKHGIHPIYTHLLVNLPQMLGPLLFIIIINYKNILFTSLPFLSCVSGIVCLSMVKHQELRFLLPIFPLLCCSINFNNINYSFFRRKNFFFIIWVLYNFVLVFIMGFIHQNGVIQALDFFHEKDFKHISNLNTCQIWWYTYSPPTWLLGDKNNSLEIHHLNDLNPLSLSDTKKNFIFDTMGCKIVEVYDLIKFLQKKKNCKIYMITSEFMIKKLSDYRLKYKEIWNHFLHLSFDQTDFNDLNSFKPGLKIYQI